jgi:hypothetical protein
MNSVFSQSISTEEEYLKLLNNYNDSLKTYEGILRDHYEKGFYRTYSRNLDHWLEVYKELLIGGRLNEVYRRYRANYCYGNKGGLFTTTTDEIQMSIYKRFLQDALDERASEVSYDYIFLGKIDCLQDTTELIVVERIFKAYPSHREEHPTSLFIPVKNKEPIIYRDKYVVHRFTISPHFNSSKFVSLDLYYYEAPVRLDDFNSHDALKFAKKKSKIQWYLGLNIDLDPNDLIESVLYLKVDGRKLGFELDKEDDFKKFLNLYFPAYKRRVSYRLRKFEENKIHRKAISELIPNERKADLERRDNQNAINRVVEPALKSRPSAARGFPF